MRGASNIAKFMGGRTRLLIVWLLLCVLPIQAGAAFARLNCPEAPQVRENAVAAARSALPNSTAIAHGFAAVGKGLGSMPSHHHAPGADEGHDCCVNLAMSPPPAHPPFLLSVAHCHCSIYTATLVDAPPGRLERPPRPDFSA